MDQTTDYTLQNLYSVFASNKVNNNNGEDLIEILIEIKRKEDIGIIVKEE